MTKTVLSILIALVFVFGAASVTVAAAQQSQPGEPLYAGRTWSTQIFHQQDRAHVSERAIPTQSQILEQADHAIQTQSSLHKVEITQSLQSTALLDDCGQSEANGQCGFSKHVGESHTNNHPHRDHGKDRTHQQNGGSNHENDGSNHEQDDH